MKISLDLVILSNIFVKFSINLVEMLEVLVQNFLKSFGSNLEDFTQNLKKYGQNLEVFFSKSQIYNFLDDFGQKVKIVEKISKRLVKFLEDLGQIFQRNVRDYDQNVHD